eukprot:4911024-Amphidinium_carterae.1
MESRWPQWEAEVFRYERESGKQIPMEIRMSVVLNRAPTATTVVSAPASPRRSMRSLTPTKGQMDRRREYY